MAENGIKFTEAYVSPVCSPTRASIMTGKNPARVGITNWIPGWAEKYADSHPEQPKRITINAWNEWVEGSYLLPDMLNGYGYLKAVKKVMSREYDQYYD